MRLDRFRAALAFPLILSCLCTGSAQTQKNSIPQATEKANDPRDLSGVWFDDRPRPVTTKERYWIYKFNAEEPPMTAWGEAQFKAAKTSFGTPAYPLAETNDSVYQTCAPAGFPRVFLHPFPIQIVQTKDEVIILFEYDSLRHQIFTDGRKHDESLGPLWMGDAIGRWEGDTLVADTVNFNDKTWVDRMGHPHSDALHIVERIKRVDHDHLMDDITIEDAKAYTKPWTAHIEFTLHPKWTLEEQFCEDQESFQTMDKDAAAPAK